MNELKPFSRKTLQQQAIEYTESLAQFLQNYPTLKSVILGHPIDHLAIKAYATEDYDQFIESIKAFVLTPFTFTPMDNRRIATAILKEPIQFLPFGQTEVLEIIEPKPEKAKKTAARFDHIEIFNPDFPTIEKILVKQSISFSRYQNSKHKALMIVINEKGQEIKFTNSNLKQIVAEEIAENSAFTIK